MRGIKIFLLMLAMISNVSLSSKKPVKNVSKKINKVMEDKKETKLFDFKNSKKVKVELGSNIELNKGMESDGGVNLNGSLTLYEFLKLSGKLGFGIDSTSKELRSSETWLGLGLNFKEFGNLELKMNYDRKIALSYEYKKKINDFDIDVKGGYSSYKAEYDYVNKDDNEERRESRYEIDTKLKYNFWENFTLVNNLSFWLSMFHSTKRLIPYSFLIGTGIDYKNTLLKGNDYKGTLISGIHVNHLNERRQYIVVNNDHLTTSDDDEEDNDMSSDLESFLRDSENYKIFEFETYLGYEFEKQLKKDSNISILGKLSATINNIHKSEMKERYKKDGTTYIEIKNNGNDVIPKTTTNIKLTPKIKLSYKFNKNISMDMEYDLDIAFNNNGSVKYNNKLRTGVKYTWEK
ncbi:hypothetical protein [Streptobacillus moniliformis]|uniref:hypothetical protein n=1 Tax=Streptobacillus moniliformis TaxID=34105 RepID=UPI0007E37DA7|nr:hypothetical protein [Streptobacillus moniliformis]